MRFTHLAAENWRNFRHLDIPLQRRVFLVGPNAAGKSNLLDALRFLRDVADPQGGFQRAVLAPSRQGVSHIRSLHARQYSNVVLDVSMDLEEAKWRYRLEFSQDNTRRPVVRKEEVWRDDQRLFGRPGDADKADPARLTQTHLEQVNANKDFRPVAEFLAQVRYTHLVPQLVRDRDRYVARERDPFGGDFLDQLARMQKEQRRTFDSRLKKIEGALKVAVPQLERLKLEQDERGVPHLRGLYRHWRPDAGWQSEGQFSDGTLRLLGLLWSLLDGSGPLLLEEPELSLHAAVVQYLPAMMWRLGRKAGRQTIVSTHSAEMLSDTSISMEEILLLQPSKEGTTVRPAREVQEIRDLVAAGVPPGEAVLPRTAPKDSEQLALFTA
jgi:predicted ATPase